MSIFDDINEVLDEFEAEARKRFKKGLRDKIKELLEPKTPDPKKEIQDPLQDYEIIEEIPDEPTTTKES